jgi:hypothetical protein
VLREFILDVTIPCAVALARAHKRFVSKVPGVASAMDAKSVFAGSPPRDWKDPVVPDTLQYTSFRVLQSAPNRSAKSFAMDPSDPKEAIEVPLVKLEAGPSFTR